MAAAEAKGKRHLWHVGDELDGPKLEAVFEFRKKVEDVADLLKAEEEDDKYVVLKFLQARGWNVAKAVEMFKQSVAFRTGEFSADALLAWHPPERLLRWCPGGVYGEDTLGNPVTWLLAGRADFKSVYHLGTRREHVKFRHWQLNVLIRQARILSKLKGKYIGQSTMVVDLDGLGWSNLYMPMVRIFNEVNHQAQHIYPEVARRIIIINPPGFFSAVYALIKPFLFERLIDKIIVCPGKPYEALSEHIPHEHIFKMYGGGAPDPDPTAAALITRAADQVAARAECASEREYVAKEAEVRGKDWTWEQCCVDGHAPISMCGVVPASDLIEVQFDSEGATAVDIPAGKAVHVCVHVAHRGGVIAYEFKSEGGEVGFQLSFSPVGDAVGPGAAGAKVLMPMEKIAAHEVREAGVYECSEAGTYVVTFDNSSSWVSTRHVMHRIEHRVTV